MGRDILWWWEGRYAAVAVGVAFGLWNLDVSLVCSGVSGVHLALP